jgi:hypothetical protein
VETILELGSHEGSHSLQLAGRPGVRRVLGLEGQEDNLRRAQLLLDVYRPENLEFRRCNLEHFEPGQYGRFDAVFCAGLLYHLPEPWRLIEKIAGMCRFLYLDTHYAASEKSFAGPYAGSWFEEKGGGLSGLSSRSFWLCFKDLLMLLMANGFLVRYVRDLEETPYGPRAWFFAEKVDPAQVGSRRSERFAAVAAVGPESAAGAAARASRRTRLRRWLLGR